MYQNLSKWYLFTESYICHLSSSGVGVWGSGQLCIVILATYSNADQKPLRLAHAAGDLGQGATYLIASSNTLFKFLWVKAEHSKYLWARISLATIKAWSYETGSIRFCLKLSSVAGSSLKSSFVPTRMMGTEGAWWSISGNHYDSEVSTCLGVRSRYLQTFARTLSKDGGETIEKQIKKTSVWGYDRGRNRS